MANRILTFLSCFLFFYTLNAQNVSLEPKQDAKKPLWGFIDKNTGKWVVKPSYNVVNSFEQGSDGKYRALVTKGNLQGFLGPDGQPLGAGIVFEKIEPLMEGNNLFVTVKGKIGVINPDGDYIQKPTFTQVSPLGKEGYFVIEKDKKGFITPEGLTLISPIYSEIDPSEEGFFILKKGNKAGITNRKGDIILEPSKFTGVEKFGDYWKIRNGKKVGLFDSSMKKVLVEPKYGDVIEPLIYAGGMIFPVMKPNGKWGAINSGGKEVVSFKNQSMTPVPGLQALRVHRNNVCERLYFPQEDLYLELSYFSKSTTGPFEKITGKIAEPTEEAPDKITSGLSFREMFRYSRNYPQRKNTYNKLGKDQNFEVIIDNDGNILGTNGVKVNPFGSNWLVMSPLKPWAVYDSNGSKVTETVLSGNQRLMSKPEGWFADQNHIIYPNLEVYEYIYCGDKLQFIEMKPTGNWIPMKNGKRDFNSMEFEKVVPFTILNNTASVCNDGKWGLFADGRVKGELKYPEALQQSSINGYFLIGRSGERGLMNSEGVEVLKPEYESFKPSGKYDLVDVSKNGYTGLFNLKSNNWILPMSMHIKQYEFLYNDPENRILIYNGKWGLSDSKGKIILPMNYDKKYVLDSLKPKQKKAPTTVSKPKKKQEEPRKKSTTEFQESKQVRRF